MNLRDNILNSLRQKVAQARITQRPRTLANGIIVRHSYRTLLDTTPPPPPPPPEQLTTGERALKRFYRRNIGLPFIATRLQMARHAGDYAKIFLVCYENCFIAIDRHRSGKHCARLYFNKQHIATTYVDSPTFRIETIARLVRTRITLKRFSLTEHAQHKQLMK